MKRPCSMIVIDEEETRRMGWVVTRPCGAGTRAVLTVRGDTLFAVCSRHDARLRRAFGAFGFEIVR